MLRDFAIDAAGYRLEIPVLNHSSLPVVTGLEQCSPFYPQLRYMYV